MTTDLILQLGQARTSLRDLAEGVAKLSAGFPVAFTDPDLMERLQKFERAAQEADARLRSPTLSIATLGTTSSGKSTVVNGLIARRVAPIEAGEMSAGVLVLKNSEKYSMTVSAADNGSWEAGTWPDLTDREIYDRTRNQVMRRYHEIRRVRECIAPEVVVSGPMLPLRERALLDLPQGMDLEIIDLPGLKSVQDRTNLAVIQDRVHKAFSLVTLDYLQTDELNRKRLLEELKRVVEFIEGQTHSMIFLLNRVDARAQNDDFPLHERVETLQREIAQILGLKEPPDVLPICARLLYYAECSWGPAPLDGKPEAVAHDQIENLRALFIDCASWLRVKTAGDRDTRDWLRTIEDSLGQPGDTVKPLPLNDHRKLVRLAREWSGGTELWARLRSRISSSFAELVLLPVLLDVFQTYDALSQALGAVSRVRKIESREELKDERNRLNGIRTRLHAEVGSTRERFRSDIAAGVEALKTDDQKARADLTKKKGFEGFEPLLEAVNIVAGDLNAMLVSPVRDAFKSELGVYDLEEDLQKVISPRLARDVARAYDYLSKRVPSMRPVGKELELRLRDNAPDVQKHLEGAERDSRRLYQAMRQALAARAEFRLQAQARKIKDALAGLIQKQAAGVRALCSENFPELGLDEAIGTSVEARIRADAIKLPDTFFTLPQAIAQIDETVDEKTGEERRTRKTGTCFKSTEHYVVDKKKKVKYRIVRVAGADQMAEQWSEGIKAGEAALWERLREWMTEALNESAAAFSGDIDAVLDLTQRALEDQRLELDLEHRTFIARWMLLDEGLLKTTQVCRVLRGLAAPCIQRKN